MLPEALIGLPKSDHGQPNDFKYASISSKLSLKTENKRSSLPIANHCAPWPVKQKASRGFEMILTGLESLSPWFLIWDTEVATTKDLQIRELRLSFRVYANLSRYSLAHSEESKLER